MPEEVDERPREVSLFEAHFQEGLMLCIVALLGWTLYSVNESSIKIATLTERVAALTTQVEAATQNRYTSIDAARDQAVVNDRIAELAARIRDVESSKK